MSRKWKTWPKRFTKEIENTSGMFALGSSAAALVGAFVAMPLVILGSVGLGGVLFYAGLKSIPPKVRSSSELIGSQLLLEDLSEIDPPILKLAVIGATQSGKSTFLAALQHSARAPTRTNRIYAEILTLPGSTPKFVALLDADGQEFYQQFEVIKKADFIVFFVDHNISSTEKNRAVERLAKHEEFKSQIEPVLRERKTSLRFHLVFNKRDLWEDSENSTELQKWFETQCLDWEKILKNDTFTFSLHSNKSVSDTAEMMEIIRQFSFNRTAP